MLDPLILPPPLEVGPLANCLYFSLDDLGTADNERVFSVLNLVTRTRRNFKDTTIDGIVRVRCNGPKLEHFNALDYAKYWIYIQNKKAVDDESKIQEKEKEDPNTYYDESTIF